LRFRSATAPTKLRNRKRRSVANFFIRSFVIQSLIREFWFRHSGFSFSPALPQPDNTGVSPPKEPAIVGDPLIPKSRGRKSRRPAEGPADFSAGFNDFNQLALWTAATLAGMVSSMLLARTPFFRKLLSRLYPERQPANPGRRPTRGEALPMLADAIVGSPKATILAVFGPPRGAVVDGTMDPAATGYWQAQTWYYPLPRNGRLAMAIEFDDEMARHVDFFSAPTPTK
jgi:hypothetical protein